MTENKHFFSDEQTENFGKSVVMALMGAILYAFGNLLTKPENSAALNNISTAFGWVGFLLILSSMVFATWKFRSGLFPWYYNERSQETNK